MDGAEAQEKQRTVTVAVGRPRNLQKSRVSQPFGEKNRKKVTDTGLKWRNQVGWE